MKSENATLEKPRSTVNDGTAANIVEKPSKPDVSPIVNGNIVPEASSTGSAKQDPSKAQTVDIDFNIPDGLAHKEKLLRNKP